MKKELEVFISVERAKALIKQYTPCLPPQVRSLGKAVGYRLANPVYSDWNVPAFWQSSMDGYAFAWEAERTVYQLIGEVPAGSNQPTTVGLGEAVRIFTGAPLPEGTDTVVMQEKSMVEGSCLRLMDSEQVKGINVRAPGSDIAAGSLALDRGERLSPGAIGFLAGMGKTEVEVYPRPKATILVTGNELQVPGQPLLYGQVYESNSVALQAALVQLGIEDIWVEWVKDDKEQLQKAIERALERSDLLLVTGGVSVGAYDFTVEAAKGAGVELVFHKIKQKPGKPLLFGRRDARLFFGLPGNPASVLTCFYEYVFPAIGQMQGLWHSLSVRSAPLAVGFKKKPGLTQFMKARLDGEAVHLTVAQASYQLAGFATANCLAVFPESVEEVKAGELVEIHLLPNDLGG